MKLYYIFKYKLSNELMIFYFLENFRLLLQKLFLMFVHALQNKPVIRGLKYSLISDILIKILLFDFSYNFQLR